MKLPAPTAIANKPAAEKAAAEEGAEEKAVAEEAAAEQGAEEKGEVVADENMTAPKEAQEEAAAAKEEELQKLRSEVAKLQAQVRGTFYHLLSPFIFQSSNSHA